MCEVTILMPCLNEAETLAVCIRKAKSFLADNHVDGEILIADNGSTDGSQEIARAAGVRVLCGTKRIWKRSDQRLLCGGRKICHYG